MTTTVTLAARAKINLFLHVGTKRADGFHPLQSLAVFTDMGDVLEIGVLGFPPARYECVGEIRSGFPVWMPSGLKAA